MELTGWQGQLRKGAAELVVLAIVARDEAYGLAILERAGDAGELLSEGTLYQLLNRLEREGKLESRWVDPAAGHARRYYRLTPLGAQMLAAMRDIWRRFSLSVTSVLEEGDAQDDRSLSAASRRGAVAAR